MANVQPENGYTIIANQILDKLSKIKLNSTQYRLIFVIWRYTYGFKRKEHDLSLNFLSEATGCDRRNIQRELKDLEDQGIIKQQIKLGVNRIIGFNKDYDCWKLNNKYAKSIETTDDNSLTVGEIDNTETTVGEIDNSTVGEIAIGEINNSEQKNILKTIDMAALDTSTVGEIDNSLTVGEIDNKEILNKNINKVDEPKIESKNPHKEIVKYFCDKHKKSTSFPYKFNGGKDGKILTDLLKTYDANTMIKIIDWYFVTDDDFLVKAGYSIGMLPTAIPKYISSLNKSKKIQTKKDPYKEA